MNVKDIIPVIFCYLFLRVVDKIIEDNLPSLHYKNLGKLFETYISAVLLTGYIGYLSILVKITKDTELKKKLLLVLTVVAITAHFDKLNKQKNNNQYVA